MKKSLSVFLITIMVVLFSMGENNGVSVRRSERKQAGTVVRKSDSFFRNGRQVLLTVKTLVKPEIWKTTRSYNIGNDISFSETDEDGDGHFELLILFPGAGKSLEAFDRPKNGEVTPVPLGRLRVLQKQFERMESFFGTK